MEPTREEIVDWLAHPVTKWRREVMIRDRETFQNQTGDGRVKHDLNLANFNNGAIFVLNEYISLKTSDDFFEGDEE